MKKRRVLAAMIVAIIALGGVSQAAFGQGSIIVPVPGNMEQGFDNGYFIAQMLKLKGGFKLGEEYKGRSPLMNLDMFFKLKVLKSPVNLPRVFVAIPLDYIRSHSQSKTPDQILKNLSFWDPVGQRWVAVQSLIEKEIGRPEIKGDTLYIEILTWPLDDRLIGC